MKNYIQYDRLPEFYIENESRLETSCAVVAENSETGMAVCVTKVGGGPAIMVFRNGEQIKLAYPTGCDGIDDVAMKMCVEYLIDPEDDEPACEPGEPVFEDGDIKVYEDEYIDYSVVEDACHSVVHMKECDPEFADAIFEMAFNRKEEIKCAVEDLLNVLLEYDYGDYYSDDLTDHILQYLAEEYSESVWAPTVVETEDGEVLEPYPYDIFLSIPR